MTDDKQNLKNRLLQDIRAGEVEMTPRIYFVLRLAGLAATALATLVVTVFLFNFIFFMLRVSGNEALLGFGPQGWRAFVWFFPWHLLIIDGLLIVLLQHLVRQFRFGYRVPILYVVAGLLALAFALGFALDRGTPLNDRLHEGRAHLPLPMRDFYEGVRRQPPQGSGICRCEILAIEGNTLIVEDVRDSTTTLTVMLPSNSRRATTTSLAVGDIVFIAGEEEGGIIHAFGVRKETDSNEHRLPR